MEEFKAVSFELSFPILKKKKKSVDPDDDKKLGFDPNAINLVLPDLVRMVYGSFEPKHKIADDFNALHPECSKHSIEKKLKEYFSKDKRGEDPRQRYYANEEILSQLFTELPGGDANVELTAIAEKRLEPLLVEIRQARKEEEEASLEKEREKNEQLLMKQEE